MQFNRKYYLMLIIIAISLMLLLLRDSDRMNRKECAQPNNTNMTDCADINPGKNNEISDKYTAEQLIEGTSVRGGKTWTIEKEALLGY